MNKKLLAMIEATEGEPQTRRQNDLQRRSLDLLDEVDEILHKIACSVNDIEYFGRETDDEQECKS